MGQSRSLPEVLSDILTFHGAILEKKDDGSLEYLSPESLSQTLGIPEHGRLNFSYHLSFEEAINASYDSELFKAIEKLFQGKGKMAMANYSSYLPNIEKLSKVVSEKVVLTNATFRLQDIETRTVTYLFPFFKYTALSDEKKEGLFSLLVNELNLSIQSLPGNLMDIMEELKEIDTNLIQSRQETMKALQAAYSVATIVIKEELSPFIESLERRLNRDIKRVLDYYETLRFEAEKTIEKKRVDEVKGAEIEKLLGKLSAIETEKKWKIQDLISKYALNVSMEPVSAIVIETQLPIFWINIKRRLSSKRFPLTYNPLVKKMDPLPCEACYYPRGGYYICDEELHIICAICFKTCPECGRQYCTACYKHGCPKCNSRKA